MAPAASAATSLGGLNFAPAAGTDVSPINFTTVSSGAAKGCPAGATNVRGVINGPGGWTNIAALSNTTSRGVDHQRLQRAGRGHLLWACPGERLDHRRWCLQRSDHLPEPTGQYAHGTVRRGHQFHDPERVSHDLSCDVNGHGTTALTVTPASPQNTGVPVTLAATVSPAPTDGGTVQFKDGSVSVGAAATVDASGHASVTTSTLASGSHSFTAVFTPSSGSASPGSTSAASAYTVNGSLGHCRASSVPASVVQNAPANFTVTLSPSNATGTVTLKEGTTVLGTSPVSSGSATIPVTFATTGTHDVVAYYTPDSVNFAAAQSAPVAVTVTAPVPPANSETIETTIAGGTLTLSIANSTTVVLPTPTLDQAAGLLVTSGAINPVTVTDTRAGAPGFVVSGQVTDFLSRYQADQRLQPRLDPRRRSTSPPAWASPPVRPFHPPPVSSRVSPRQTPRWVLSRRAAGHQRSRWPRHHAPRCRPSRSSLRPTPRSARTTRRSP